MFCNTNPALSSKRIMGKLCTAILEAIMKFI
jgi:hypothetical protein